MQFCDCSSNGQAIGVPSCGFPNTTAAVRPWTFAFASDSVSTQQNTHESNRSVLPPV